MMEEVPAVEVTETENQEGNAPAEDVTNPDGEKTGGVSDETVVKLARICHEANRTYCEVNGDMSQKPWDETPEDRRDSAIDGVRAIVANPGMTAEDSHVNWVHFRMRNGWTYGPEKSDEAKTHPSILPYNDLPIEERYKDYLFHSIVKGFLDFLTLNAPA